VLTAAPPDLSADQLRLIDRVVERNARLIVRLTHAQREIHDRLHDRRSKWMRCVEESCRSTVRAIEQNTLEGGV